MRMRGSYLIPACAGMMAKDRKPRKRPGEDVSTSKGAQGHHITGGEVSIHRHVIRFKAELNLKMKKWLTGRIFMTEETIETNPPVGG